MNITLITDATPSLVPVQVSDCAQYLRLESAAETADANQIQLMISAARLEAENEQARELSQKQWTLALDRFPVGGYYNLTTPFTGNDGGYRELSFRMGHNFIELLDPLISVTSFTYKDYTGTVNTMTPNVDYIVDTMKHPGIVCPAYGTQWPTATLWPSSAVQITFEAGFVPSTNPCPWTVRQGILLLVSQWYEGRIPFEAIRFAAELPFSVTSLFRAGKLWRF